MTDPLQPGTPGPDYIGTECETAREQIAAAWQLHVEQIQEQLERGWREQVSVALEERFAALRSGFEAELERKATERSQEELERGREAARRAMSERLNQTARRLDQADDLPGWASALLDGAAAFSSTVMLFSLINGELQYEDHRSERGLGLGPLGDRIPLLHAPAFAGVVDSQDAVIAMATAAEISPRLASVVGDQPDKRVCLLPIVVGQSENKRRVAAVLYVEGDGEPVDVNLLEVIASLAGLRLDARQASQRTVVAAPAGNLMAIAPVVSVPGAPPVAASVSGPDWSAMTREEQELHAKAQRFARVRVAEMRLYQAQAVREGREQARLYSALKGEMDRGRAQFKHEFMSVTSMLDYFHLELVRTLANDDASLLGEDYPGPLV